MLDEFLNSKQSNRNSKLLRSYIVREILGKSRMKSSGRDTKELT